MSDSEMSADSAQSDSHSNHDEAVVTVKKMILVNLNDTELLALTKCGQCFRKYDQTKRQPVSMTCGHTMCESCMVRTTIAGIHTCIICNKSTILIIDENNKNLIIYRLLEKMNLFETKPRPTVRTNRSVFGKLLTVINSETFVIYQFNHTVHRAITEYRDSKKISNFSRGWRNFSSTLLHAETAMKSFIASIQTKLIKLGINPSICNIDMLHDIKSNDEIPETFYFESDDQDLTEMRRCCVCYENYNKTNFAPISVSCGHTFCRRCVRRLIKGRFFDCCICRVATCIGPDCLTENFVVIKLLEKLNMLAPDEHSEVTTFLTASPDEDSEYDLLIEDFINSAISENRRYSTLMYSYFMRPELFCKFPDFLEAYQGILFLINSLLTFGKELEKDRAASTDNSDDQLRRSI